MSSQSDQLRRMTGLVGETSWSDTDLDDLLTANGGDMRLAAADVYDRLAAQYSSLVNVSESGSSRSMGDMYKNALAMAAHYRGGESTTSTGTVTRRTRVGQIERA